MTSAQPPWWLMPEELVKHLVLAAVVAWLATSADLTSARNQRALAIPG